MEPPLFIVTPWRNSAELLELRRNFYNHPSNSDPSQDKRRQAVNKVLAWRLRKPELPLLLDSTADLVDAVLQDERSGREGSEGESGLGHNGLRLVYAAAVSRFVTGFSDTQLDLRRARPSFLSSNNSLSPASHHATSSISTSFLTFPKNLLETRHSIVHRQLPSLYELKRAAQQGLDWLWEWYWSHLDAAFGLLNGGVSGEEEVDERELREKVQVVLKGYIRARKIEVKSRSKGESTAAEIALSSISTLIGRGVWKEYEKALVELLVDARHIIPAERKTGDDMSGAFLLWNPIITALASSTSSFTQTLIDRLIATLNSQAKEPVKDAMLQWLVQFLTSPSFRDPRSRTRGNGKLVEQTLSTLFTSPTSWNLNAAEAILQDKNVVQNYEAWIGILKVGGNEGTDIELEMEVDSTELGVAEEGGEKEEQAQVEVAEEKGQEQVKGPQKVLGMWRPRPIGAIPVGWEDDE